jgi:hypothetical protein
MFNKRGNVGVQITLRPLRYILSLFVLAMLITVWNKPNEALATTVTPSSVNVDVNYLEEIIIVKPGTGGSTKFYISLDKQKSWENLDPSGVVDISAMLSTKAVVVYFKGNRDTTAREFTLMAEPNYVTASYVINNGIGQVVSSTSGPAIEYRKGNNGSWRTASATMSTAIYEVKGATLYFRSIANAGVRAGKIISVKIPKRPSAPSVKLDGSKLLISGIKANETQYFNPTKGIWEFLTTDTKVKTVTLYTLTNISAAANSPIPAASFEFRNNGGIKKVVSSVKLIEVPLQPVCPDTIKLVGSTLTITDATNKVYEYTRMQSTALFNAASAKWTTIQANKAVIIPKAYVTERIYVRLKSTVDKVSKQVIPASTYRDYVVTSVTVK